MKATPEINKLFESNYPAVPPEGLRLEYSFVLRTGSGEIPFEVFDVISMPMGLKPFMLGATKTYLQSIFEYSVQRPIYIALIEFIERYRDRKLQEQQQTVTPGVFAKDGEKTRPLGALTDPFSGLGAMRDGEFSGFSDSDAVDERAAA